MDRAISLKAAIDAIKGLEFCHYMEFGEYIGEDTREVRLIRAEKAQDTLQKLPSAQQWIPCSERLPKEKDAGILKKLGTSKRSEYVLATVEVKGERMTVTACTYDGEWDWNMKYAFPDYKIIAWMPLPEPWKGESEETE